MNAIFFSTLQALISRLSNVSWLSTPQDWHDIKTYSFFTSWDTPKHRFLMWLLTLHTLFVVVLGRSGLREGHLNEAGALWWHNRTDNLYVAVGCERKIKFEDLIVCSFRYLTDTWWGNAIRPKTAAQFIGKIRWIEHEAKCASHHLTDIAKRVTSNLVPDDHHRWVTMPPFS